MTIAEIEQIALKIPIVVVGLHARSEVFDTVAADDELGAQLVVGHLVELGHRRIAFAMHANGRGHETRPECHRLHGFERAMSKHGLDSGAIVVDCRWSLEGGRDAARRIGALDPPPTAVHAGADIVALGMMNELWDAGKSVPEAYSLVGYDNSNTSALGPIWLTTVDQSGVAMGERVGQLLFERIEGRSDARHDVFEPRLVVRCTTSRRA